MTNIPEIDMLYWMSGDLQRGVRAPTSPILMGPTLLISYYIYLTNDIDSNQAHRHLKFSPFWKKQYALGHYFKMIFKLFNFFIFDKVVFTYRHTCMSSKVGEYMRCYAIIN